MALRLGPDVGDPLLGIRQLVWVILGLIVCMATVFGLRNMNWLKRYKYTWALLEIPGSINDCQCIARKKLEQPDA